MKLQHSSYKAYTGKDEYIPIFYNWELGMFAINAKNVDDKWHDLIDHSLPHCGYTTEHLKDEVERLTGKRVKRLVTW